MAGRNSLYVTYCCSAITIRRAIWNFSSFVSVLGSSPTMRLCSRANSVCVAVSAMFSLPRTSPATIAFSGWAASRPSTAITGALAGSPRLSRRGRKPLGSIRVGRLLVTLPSTEPSRSHSSRWLVPP
jgi:hypothetical protein